MNVWFRLSQKRLLDNNGKKDKDNRITPDNLWEINK